MKHIEELEKALSHISVSLVLSPDLECEFDRFRVDGVCQQIIYIIVTITILTLFGILAEIRLGVFWTMLPWKLGVQFPAIALGLAMATRWRPAPGRLWLAGAIPFVGTILLLVMLSLSLPAPQSDYVTTTVALAAFAAGLVVPAKIRVAILLAMLNAGIYISLPLLLRPKLCLGPGLDILVFHCAVILASPVAAYFFERTHKQNFLLTRIQCRQAEKLEALVDELTRISHRDPLTGAGNRRSFDQRYDAVRQTAMACHQAFTLILVDVDHFKRFNDTAGHAAGDVCLQVVANAIARGAGCPIDAVSRYGGEEFALVLPSTGSDVAEAIRASVEAMAFPHPGLPSGQVVTVSVGLARAGPDPGSIAASQRDLLRAADAALYRAKALGRNRVVAAGGDGGRTDAG